MKVSLSFVSLLALSVIGCGQGPASPDEVAPSNSGERRSAAKPGLSMDAEIGAMNESQVNQVFKSAESGLLSCYGKGEERIPYLAGALHIVVRVDSSGAPVSTLVTRSTLGDHETESCMLRVLEKKSWPAPVGGREGIAETDFSFEPSGGARPPVEWSRDLAGKKLAELEKEKAKCGGSAEKPVSVTLYVDTDGSVVALGAASAGKGADAVARCLESAAGSIKLNSPGSYPAKLTLD